MCFKGTLGVSPNQCVDHKHTVQGAMLFSKTASRLFVAQAGLLSRYRMASGARAMSFSTSTTSSYISRSLTNAYADVHLVPMFQDNYGFIIVDKLSNTCAVVDPGDGLVIEKALNELELSLDVILCTHKHSDHIGGVLDLKRAFPSALVVGTQYEDIPGLEAPVGEGDYFQIGNLPVKVMHTPCHTSGHIAFLVSEPDAVDSEDELEHADEIQFTELGGRVKYIPTDSTGPGSSAETTVNGGADGLSRAPLLFCGDTLFVGGCGRFFEGTAAQMLRNLDRFAQLDPNTQVFCAHEYTESNFKFLSSVDPSAMSVYENVKQERAQGKGTVPTSIGAELKRNLFMQCHDLRVQQLVQAISATEAMQKLRDMKNVF